MAQSNRDTAAPLATLTHVVCTGSLLLLLLLPLWTRVHPVLSGGLLLLCLALFLAAAWRAALRASSARRALFVGIVGGGAFGFVAQLYYFVALVGQERSSLLSADVWLFVFGAHPALIAGFLAALGLPRREMQLEVLLDTLLLVAAAAIISLQLPFALPPDLDATTPAVRAVYLFWHSITVGELFLVALLLAWRGEMLGMRTAVGVTTGTIAFALANFVASAGAVGTSAYQRGSHDVLWVLVLGCFSIAFGAAEESNAPADMVRVRRDVIRLRAGSITVAILIASAASLALGFREVRQAELALAIAAFGVLLAARVGQALLSQARETRHLSLTVTSERQISADLEHRVVERTAELAEAQRVLQRMWVLGQQVALELHPARVLERFMQAVVDVAQVDGAALGLLVEGGQLRIAAGIGIGGELVGQVIPLHGSAMGRAIETGTIWCEADLLLNPGPVTGPAFRAARANAVRGFAVLPLQRRGERIGALSLASRTPRQFSDPELERVAAMADMLTVALANAELVENLRQAEWRFRTLFRAAPDAVLTVNAQGLIREANESARDLTGVDPAQLVGRSLYGLVEEADRASLAATIAGTFDGVPVRIEARFSHPDGVRLVALAASRLPEADPPTVLLVGRDVTHERDLRARLLETERLAAVGELVAGVAHEVNNPLSSISAFAQLLLRDGGLSSTQRDSVEVIKSETTRASQVVKDLLAFARRSEPQRVPVDLNLVVERSLRLRGYQLGASNVKVELDLPADLPAVIGDGRQLQQVVLNLITNSIQAMQRRNGGTLFLATRVLGENVQVEVRDTGVGIPPQHRARIFEPFFTTKPEGEGTGLGLSVSYGIVAAHDGTLALAESSDAGTRFVLTLPSASAAADGARGMPVTHRSALAGLRVLLIDDEPAMRESIEAFGELRGFEVETAAEGVAALDLVQRRSFDAVICDLRMPGMDGTTFHAELRRERPGLAARTIFMTGDIVATMHDPRIPADQPTIAKPFTFERLEEMILAVLRGQRVGAAGEF